jgi:hypothetical protein
MLGWEQAKKKKKKKLMVGSIENKLWKGRSNKIMDHDLEHK